LVGIAPAAVDVIAQGVAYLAREESGVRRNCAVPHTLVLDEGIQGPILASDGRGGCVALIQNFQDLVGQPCGLL
jgi:hypothetical protein